MLFPSIPKLCTLGALLFAAHQASAQSPENEIPNWTLKFNGFSSEFRRGEQYEISLDYSIGTGRESFEITPMETGCKTELDIVGKDQTLSDAADGVQEMKIFLDLDKAGLVNSPIWNNVTNSVEMCMRIELKSGDMVIKRDERDIQVNLDFRVEFNTIEDVNMTQLSLPTGPGGEPFEGLLQLVSIGVLDVSGYDTTGVEEDHPIIQVFQSALENFQTEQGVEFKVTGFDGVSVGRSLRQRQLTNDTFEVGFVAEISNFCNGTTECAGDAFDTFNSIKANVYDSVLDGNFTVDAKEEAAAQGVDGVDDMSAFNVIMIVDTIRAIGFTQISATVDNYVEACTCDGSNNFNCNTNLLGPNDYLNVCIKSVNTEIEIDNLGNMTVTQDGSEFVIVQNGGLVDSTISSKTKVTQENGMHVASVIPATFFSYESNTIAEVSGVVFLKLANSRRRLAVELTEDPEVDATGSTRALATPLDTTETGFAISVVLAKNELEAVLLEEDGASASTKVNVMMTGIIVASAASAVAIMVFFFVKKSRGLSKNSPVAKSVSSVI
mmetsp:Transcript_17228/g.24377  ORF Transcript_17228/g.24377 Transcript_17228/m.24377 type:complete len:551 (-) Transcript_17228:144-1796(-)